MSDRAESEWKGLPIERVLACSTGHFYNSEAITRLVQNKEYITSYDTPYGVIVVVPSPWKTGEDLEGEGRMRLAFGDCIVDILKYAAKLNCWAVNFDCDCDPLPTFPTFEW